MTVFCRSCGTEVEQDALFCPACGEPISAAAPELPPAPDWPEPPPRSPEAAGGAKDEGPPSPGPEAPAEDAMEATAEPADETSAVAGPASDTDAVASPAEAAGRGEPSTQRGDEPGDQPGAPVGEPAPEPRGASRDAISTAPQAVPPWRRGAAFRGGQGEAAPPAQESPGETPPGAGPPPKPEAPQPGPPPGRPQALAGAPTTLSGWLIGGGSAVGLLALFLPWISGGGSYVDRWGLAYGINFLVLVALVAVAAVVFAADVIPAFPRRNLAVLGVAFVGVGIGLDRGTQAFAQFGAVIFLLAMLAAAAGALLVELEMDRPIGPPGGPQA